MKSQVILYKLFTDQGLQAQYDPTIVPLPWNEVLFCASSPLKIGYFTSLPVFPAFGDTPATILRAKLSLEQRNYEVVEFPMPDSFDLCRSIFGLFWSDLGKGLMKEFEHEPVTKSGASLVAHAQMPGWVAQFPRDDFSCERTPNLFPTNGGLVEHRGGLPNQGRLL